MKQYVVKYIIPEDYDVSDKPDIFKSSGLLGLVYLQHSAALEVMASLLSEGVPAWIVESDWTDEVPF